MERKNISSAVINRLPRYYRYLGELKDAGVERISSGDLSKKMNVTASQIRQDLNNFGGFGQQGYGYNVEYLYEEIGKILGLDKSYNVIIIGAGNLGRAIANYSNFEKRGFIVKAIFDKNAELKGTKVRGIEVKHIDELKSYIEGADIDIVALAIPKTEAGAVADMLVEHGIKAFWNFAHMDLDVPGDVVVENVHLSESLMRLSYNLAKKED